MDCFVICSIWRILAPLPFYICGDSLGAFSSPDEVLPGSVVFDLRHESDDEISGTPCSFFEI